MSFNTVRGTVEINLECRSEYNIALLSSRPVSQLAYRGVFFFDIVFPHFSLMGNKNE